MLISLAYFILFSYKLEKDIAFGNEDTFVIVLL